MRTETLWGGERRAARAHWWGQVLDSTAAVNRKELFDEELTLRFGTPELSHKGMGQDLSPATPC